MEEIDADIKKKRNKLIRLADKSAAGWDLVNEYLSDDLASGSHDEKRIRRATLKTKLRGAQATNVMMLRGKRKWILIFIFICPVGYHTI